MKNFHKHVFRTVVGNKGSFAGAVLIIAIGIFVYVAMMDTLRNLKEQIFSYYDDSGLADVFAVVSGISQEELKLLEEIPGIRKVSGKLSEDVRLLGKGQEEIVTVHLLSYRADEEINRLTLSKASAGQGELFLGVKMEAVYDYESGEPLRLLCRGESFDFVYAGTCQAPDYIYSIPPGGAMIPDGEVYDIACMDEERMREILGKPDGYTELGFLLAPGFSFEDVKDRLKEALEGCGLISLCERDGQTSFNMVDGEMGELISVGTILPVLFMAISVFMLYVVLKKAIDQDQRLIGTMKAFGMTDRELMSGYLAEGGAAGLIGAVAGGVLASPFGRFMFGMYLEFFALPDTVYHDHMDSRIIGAVIGAGTGLLAVFWGVRDIFSIAPAQAMRARTPKTAGGPGHLFSWSGRLGISQKMAFRSMARNPFRCFLIVLSVGFPFAMSSVLFSFEGVAEQMFFDQFEKIQVYDLQLSLDGLTSPIRARQGGESLEGVKEAEAVLRIAAGVQSENLTEQTLVYGLTPGSRMWKIMDTHGVYYDPPRRGIIINRRTAEALHVDKGDVVRVSSPGITVDQVELAVWDVIDESFGSSCYMSMEGMAAAFPVGEAANTVLLRVEEEKKGEVKDQVKNTGRVTWLVDADKVIGSYRDMMGSMLAMIYMFALLSVVAGGILLGIPGSLGVRMLIEKLVMSESYSVTMEVGPWAYGAAFAVCLAITAAAWVAEDSFVKKICLTDILKERE